MYCGVYLEYYIDSMHMIFISTIYHFSQLPRSKLLLNFEEILVFFQILLLRILSYKFGITQLWFNMSGVKLRLFLCSFFSKDQLGLKKLHRIGILIRFCLLLELWLTTVSSDKECWLLLQIIFYFFFCTFRRNILYVFRNRVWFSWFNSSECIIYSNYMQCSVAVMKVLKYFKHTPLWRFLTFCCIFHFRGSLPICFVIEARFQIILHYSSILELISHHL